MASKNFEIINTGVLRNAVTVNAVAGVGGIRNGSAVMLVDGVANYPKDGNESTESKYVVFNLLDGQGLLENINEENYTIKEGDPLRLLDMTSVASGLETISLSFDVIEIEPIVGEVLVPSQPTVLEDINGKFHPTAVRHNFQYNIFVDKIVTDEKKFCLCHVEIPYI